MAELEKQGSALAGVTLEGSDFASLLKKEFKPKTDEARSAVEQAVRDLIVRFDVKGGFFHRGRLAHKGDHGAVVIHIGVLVEHCYAGYGCNGLDDRFDHFGPARFREIRNTFDQ